MHVIPVLDILGGRAVHARGGSRADYRPIASTLRPGSDPVALAAAVRDRLGLRSLYVADLDAILGRAPATGLHRELAALDLETWIDAGLRDRSGVPPLIEAGVSRIIVGLETVAGPNALRAIVDAAGPGRVAFSLDLREGRPIVTPGSDWSGDGPCEIVERAVGAGVSTLILLDLARVGSGTGVGTLGLLGSVRARFPGVDWIIGGGVSGPADLGPLERAGASAVLVGSAIHDGRIGEGDLPPC